MGDGGASVGLRSGEVKCSEQSEAARVRADGLETSGHKVEKMMSQILGSGAAGNILTMPAMDGSVS